MNELVFHGVYTAAVGSDRRLNTFCFHNTPHTCTCMYNTCVEKNVREINFTPIYVRRPALLHYDHRVACTVYTTTIK